MTVQPVPPPHASRTLDGPVFDIGVVGSGIGALSAAWLLSRQHRVTVYEAGATLGGHSCTVDVHTPGRVLPVDAGFMVFNETNYPNLTALFAHLGVATRPSDMSFAVSLAGGALEYAGGRGPLGLLAQGANAVRPRFWRMAADIVRFFREAPELADDPALRDVSLGAWLAREGYSAAFRDDHLVPMAAAIWSGSSRSILDFPAATFLRFCTNHGLLRFAGRPQWRTVAGGSRRYVERLAAGVSGPIHLSTPVHAVRRRSHGVAVLTSMGEAHHDHVVLGTHADQALAVLADAARDERAVLGAFGYSDNRGVVHGDPALMPRRRTAWASWNYVDAGPGGDAGRPVSVTYWLNRLQGHDPRHPVFMSLNPARDPDPARVHRELSFRHPQFDAAAIAAQARMPGIQGRGGVWYAGAWLGYGFHEDGLQAGIGVARALGVEPPWRVEGEVRVPPVPGWDRVAAPDARARVA